jgi:hypothetical protein
VLVVVLKQEVSLMLTFPREFVPRSLLETYRRPLVVLGGAMIVTLLIALVGLAVDPRVVTNAPAWMKPAKFAASILIYAATLWVLLPAIADRPVFVRVVSWAVLLGLGLEMALIALQAARGTTSHFNNTTAFDAMVFRAMGATIMVIWLLTMIVAALFFRRHLAHPALTWGVRLGFIGTIVGMGVAILMTLPTPEQQQAAAAGLPTLFNGAHSVGVADGGPGLPIVGWSTTGGDLRIGHFVGLHALQVVPLVALLVMRFSPSWLSARGQAQITGVAGVAWLALTLLLTWQALRGQPVTAPDDQTIAGLLAIVIGAGLLAGMVLVRSVRARPIPVAVRWDDERRAVSF